MEISAAKPTSARAKHSISLKKPTSPKSTQVEPSLSSSSSSSTEAQPVEEKAPPPPAPEWLPAALKSAKLKAFHSHLQKFADAKDRTFWCRQQLATVANATELNDYYVSARILSIVLGKEKKNEPYVDIAQDYRAQLESDVENNRFKLQDERFTKLQGNIRSLLKTV